MGNLMKKKSSKKLNRDLIKEMNQVHMDEIDEVIMILNEDFPLTARLKR